MTSPASLTHSASTPSGTRSWGMPGATLTTARRVSSRATNGHGGVQPSASKTRPRAPRRAGSAKTAPNPSRSMVVPSATCTAPARPSAARLASATATRTGSRSTPATVSPARENATRSPPMPQPRSMTLDGWAAASRAARCAATRGRVACSSASGVKYIRTASSPNLATARARSWTWVSAAAARSASGSIRRTAAAARTGSPSASAYAWVARSSSRWPASVSSQVKESRSTPPSCQSSQPGRGAAARHGQGRGRRCRDRGRTRRRSPGR